MAMRTAGVLAAVVGMAIVAGCKKEETYNAPDPTAGGGGTSGAAAAPATAPATRPSDSGLQTLTTRPALPDIGSVAGPATRPIGDAGPGRLPPLPGTMPATLPSSPSTDFNK